ncbi:hypothetical protein I6N95_21425 [Vagococcus sp. BWB3-3]|uniref:Uncharacterized protein n=1 Tax=Vagococcus allomyrinae TaxID=2794353 RepID=A0A940PCK2_9ENTE|nr:hypothetical protein [Vagococcus allomyrinae]MBP1043591.1 hypothetical protein [Vagococcus allomyrinae]
MLLKQVDQLGQSFKAMKLPYQSDETKQMIEKKISEALEICDILRSAADLGKSPNEMIGYYLLGAKQQADELLIEKTIGPEENLENLEKTNRVSELSQDARLYAGTQREEMANQLQLLDGSIKNGKKEIVPLVVTKRNELLALEEALNTQIDELRHHYDLPEALIINEETQSLGEESPK